MATREILTIQLGHYSNFVGTHWWNLQETNFSYDANNPSEINADVLYREGEYQKKVTFTPRLLIADLKGTLGYLSEDGNLSEISENQINHQPEFLWDENSVETQEEPKTNKPPFIQSLEQAESNGQTISFDLEKETRQWVDFLTPRFHPRTLNIISEYEHESSSKPFDIFPYGQHIWKTKQFSDDFVNRIRVYVEECDSIQGFQVLFDADDGFAGLGASCMEHLKDEYSKSIITWPIIDATPREPSVSDHMKVINSVLCWQSAGEFSSLFSPLCCGTSGWLTPGSPRIFDNINYRSDLKYHTSALLATALDTLSLRYRHKKYPLAVMSDLCADLNKVGRKAVATSLSLPFPMVKNHDLIDVLDDLDSNRLWTSLTPSCTIEMDNVMQSLALKGISENRLKRPMQDAKKQMEKAAYRCSSVHEMMSLYLDCTCFSSSTYLTTAGEGLKIKDPYPKVFRKNIQRNGDFSTEDRDGDVESIPVMAGLHSGRFIAEMYESLHSQVKKIKSIRRFHAYTDSGLEEDDFRESINNLLDCKENYEDHYV
ncbi:hypothetical protein QAD02_014591 [Eretmocerus hayati]|uniref:Uncharacterized protein n=1 Tax=Eretmocerus hayati TaxID=131215 RepID=A0ACC2P5E2_9HYME|nr:hypothetical protein QAD02_014591 [Eretmocerus hayati]